MPTPTTTQRHVRRLVGAIACAFSLNAQAASIPPDWLHFSEVMANPAAVSDSAGEWFELTNIGTAAVNLDGFELRDNGRQRHLIDSPTGRLELSPGQFMLFGRRADPLVNGGMTPDYIYSGFTLSNGADALRLVREDEDVASLDYGAGFAVAGVSRELGRIGSGLGARASDYLLAVDPFGAGDLGTPGFAGQFGSVSAVPLPAAIWLFLGALGFIARPRAQAHASSRIASTSVSPVSS